MKLIISRLTLELFKLIRSVYEKEVFYYVLGATIILGRYLQEHQKSSLYEAENFYFTSDLLKEESSVSFWKDGVNKLKINFSNSADKLRYTKSDINAVVRLSEFIDNREFVKKREINLTLEGNKITNKEIVFDNLEKGAYKIEAITSSPYVKKLEGIFSIDSNNNNIKHLVNDRADSTVLMLKISTIDYEGNIKIKFPDGLYPDNNEDAFKDVDIDNSKEVIVKFKHHSSYTYKFYKKDPKKIFKEDDFEVGGV